MLQCPLLHWVDPQPDDGRSHFDVVYTLLERLHDTPEMDFNKPMFDGLMHARRRVLKCLPSPLSDMGAKTTAQ